MPALFVRRIMDELIITIITLAITIPIILALIAGLWIASIKFIKDIWRHK